MPLFEDSLFSDQAILAARFFKNIYFCENKIAFFRGTKTTYVFHLPITYIILFSNFFRVRICFCLFAKKKSCGREQNSR